MPETVARVQTPRGELVLRREGRHYEIVSNGTFLMDTRGGASERALVALALAGRRGPLRVLLGGLGVGFSLHEVLRGPAVQEVTVLEVEPALVEWHRTHLAALSAGTLDDPRVKLVCADLVDWLRTRPGAGSYDAVCLDVDNGPEWTVFESNRELYGAAGLDTLHALLAPGGRLAVWSAAAAPAFERRLRARFGRVDVRTVPVPRGDPDVVYLATRRAAAH